MRRLGVAYKPYHPGKVLGTASVTYRRLMRRGYLKADPLAEQAEGLVLSLF